MLLYVVLACPASLAAHPQTVWDAAELTRLQNARTTTHAPLATHLQNLVSQRASSQVSPQYLGGYSMAALLMNHPTAISNALTQLRNLCAKPMPVPGTPDYATNPWKRDCDFGQSGTLQGVAISYDILYGQLTEAERTACRTHIAVAAQSLYLASTGDNSQCQDGTSGWWKDDPSNNHHWVNYAALGVAAHALQGEDPRTQAWLDRVDYAMREIDTQLDNFDGSWHEGIGYLTFGFERTLYFCFGAVRRDPWYGRCNLLGNFSYYALYLQQPNHPRQFVMTHGDANWVRPELAAMLRWSASQTGQYKSAAVEALVRWDLEPRSSWARAEWAGAYALEYMAYDAAASRPDMSTLPLDRYNRDQESFFMRSSWDYGTTAQTTVVAFKSGVHGGRLNRESVQDGDDPHWPSQTAINISHDHQDDLGLWIYGKGGWQLPEATAYNCCFTHTSEYQSTRWHNTFLIGGQGQLGDNKTVDRQTGISAGSVPLWFKQRDASMPMRLSTDHYAFARGDGTRLYSPSLGLTRLYRTVGFSRENNSFVALRDEVRFAPGVSHSVEQLFHAMKSHTAGNTNDVDRPWVRLDNSTPSQASPPSHFSDTALGIRVVAPASFSATYEEQVSNNFQEWYHPDGRYGLVKLSPTAPANQTTFLQVLWPTTNAAWASRPDVQPLEAAFPERGFSLPHGQTTEHWVYSTGLQPTAAGPFTFKATSDQDIAVVRWGTGCSQLLRAAIAGSGVISVNCGGATKLLLDTGPREGAVELAITGTRADLSGFGGRVGFADGVRFFGPAITEVRLNGVLVTNWVREGETVRIGAVAPFQLWSDTTDYFNYPGNDDRVEGVALDSQGHTYSAGTSLDTFGGWSNSDAAVGKYLPDGSPAPGWPVKLASENASNPSLDYQDKAHGVAVDSAGNVYVVGDSDGVLNSGNTLRGGRDAFLAKLDAAGAVKWVKMLGTAAEDALLAVAVDSQGHIVAAGWTRGCFNEDGTERTPCTNGYSSGLAVRYRNDGTLLGLHQEGGTASNTVFKALAVGAGGELYVSGDEGASPKQATLWRLTAALDGAAWKQKPTTEARTAGGVALDSAGNLIMVFSGPGEYEGYYAKFSQAGALVTAPVVVRGAAGAFKPQAAFKPLAVATRGTDFILAGIGPGTMEWCGGEEGSCDHEVDAWLVRFTSAGVPVWHYTNGPAGGDDWLLGVAVDGAGNVAAGGTWSNDRIYGESNASKAHLMKLAP